MRPEIIGVTKVVRDSDVYRLTPNEQDDFIRSVAHALGDDLRRFTGDAMPLSEIALQVTGPHNDPIQGMIHAHTLAATFDLDTLAPDCDAYAVFTGKAEGTTDGNTLPGGKP